MPKGISAPNTAAIDSVKESIRSAVLLDLIMPNVLLDLIMPNGKPLRDCNKLECQRAGGWLIKVAAKLKPKQLVGEAFSESQLRAIFGK